MTRVRTAKPLTLGRIALIGALAATAAVVLASAAIASGAGRLIGGLWVSVMSAIIGLFGG
ncbi:MAG: hypothetical protein K2P70_19225 [Hyphomonadaceae bacterium]|nr:hypothetical protein [Hyphomonadaceae bacterium]